MLYRLWVLRRRYLPLQASPTGDYTPEQIERMAIFRLMVSAELETYFEEVAEETLQETTIKRKAGNLTRASATLLAIQRSISSPGNIAEIKAKSFYERACADSEASHARLIEANKGASSHNLLSLLLPLGLDETRLDDQFLPNLALLAVKRGDFAHKRIGAVQNIPNPVEDQATVMAIVRELPALEQQMVEALSAN